MSQVLLIDTGSTDDTVNQAESVCAERGLSLLTDAREWRGFGQSQSELLATARANLDADYVLQLDADETLHAPDGWRWPESTPDAYRVCRIYAGDWEVWGTKVFANRAPWRYEGVRHARPVLEGATVERLEGVEIRNLRDGANGKTSREQQRERFRRDTEHFQALLSADPTDTRSAYYLAQSCHDAGMPEEALAAYERRAAMPGGFAEERYLAALQVARYRRRLRHSPEAVTTAYHEAVLCRPQRHEAYCECARWLNDRGAHRAAARAAEAATRLPPSGDLFLVQRSAQTWRPWHELARANEALGNHDDARHAWARLLTFDRLPASERALAEHRIREHRESPRRPSEARPGGHQPAC